MLQFNNSEVLIGSMLYLPKSKWEASQFLYSAKCKSVNDRVSMSLQVLTGSISFLHRCKRSAPVVKAEFDSMIILACPFPQCCYFWCKGCQREIPLEHGGSQHSCDGSNELQSLMVQRGWKQRPGYKTPTEKILGCNHISVCEATSDTRIFLAGQILAI